MLPLLNWVLIITSPSIRVCGVLRSTCLYVCLFVCSLAYLKNYTSKFHQTLHMLPEAVARSFSDSSAIRYVLPVLWMTINFFHIMQGIGPSKDDAHIRPVCQVAARVG